MTKLDKQSIQSKIARLRKNIRELGQIGKTPVKKYKNDFLLTSTTERLLQVSVQIMLDIGSHIVSEEGLGEPLEYRDIFKLLVKAKILPQKMEPSLMELTGLRNRIVHVYDEIDHSLIYQCLQNELGDMDDFVGLITKYIKKKS